MNPETVSLLSLGEHDAELQEKIRKDIERVVVAWVERNIHSMGYNIVRNQQDEIERLSLRALKNHLNNTVNLY